MTVVDHDTIETLQEAARKAPGRLQERIRAIIWAKEGRSGSEIGEWLHRDDRTIRRWVARYNAEGLAGLKGRSGAGQPPKLPREQGVAFRARLTAGPQPDDGVSVLHGHAIRRILAREFGVDYSLAGVYRLLHRLGFAPLKPRPVHPKNDREAMERWVARFPLFSRR